MAEEWSFKTFTSCCSLKHVLKMKLVAKNFEKDSSGSVVLVLEEAEDMWHAYNLIAVGDRLKSTTIRHVQTESATGSVSSNNVRTTLAIAVEGIEFDTQACMLRIKGRNVEENQYVKMGAYHTIDLELNRKFTLLKEYWDLIALERVETACDPTQHADLGAILLHEGLGHIMLVTSSMTIVRAKIDMNIPRKRKGFCSQHDKGLLRFYDAIIQGVLRHINFDVIKCVPVASPGFVKEQFCDYMFQQAIKNEWKAITENKSKFILVHSSSGHKHTLKEVLADPAVTARLADTKQQQNGGEGFIKIPVEDRDLDGVFNFPCPSSWNGCAVVLTYGAGQDMNYIHLEKLAAHLASTGILCLRFTCRTRNFQYRKECFTAVVEFLRNFEEFPVRMCVIAGRSMGAQVAAEVASNSSLTTDFVYGVACLSYPLHPPRKTSELRVSPLLHLGVPVLFINGRKDPFCRADLMENAALNRMANDWTMHWVDGADHELKVNGKVNNEIISNMCEWFVQWRQSVFMAERS